MLKYIEIIVAIVEAIRVLLETLIHDGAFGDGAEVRLSQQEVGGEIPRKWNVFAVCDLYCMGLSENVGLIFPMK